LKSVFSQMFFEDTVRCVQAVFLIYKGKGDVDWSNY